MQYRFGDRFYANIRDSSQHDFTQCTNTHSKIKHRHTILEYKQTVCWPFDSRYHLTSFPIQRQPLFCLQHFAFTPAITFKMLRFVLTFTVACVLCEHQEGQKRTATTENRNSSQMTTHSKHPNSDLKRSLLGHLCETFENAMNIHA